MISKVLIATLLFILSIVATFTIYFFIHEDLTESETLTQSQIEENTESIQAVIPQNIESKILVAGDIFWGRQTHIDSQASDLKYKYPFSGLDTFNKEAYDMWVANLECPVTNKEIPYQVQVSQLKFNCPTEYLPEFAKWFELVSLANNHTDNNDGQWGIDQTRQNLDQHNIQYFGHYNPSIKQDICEVISQPARILNSDNSELVTQIPVAWCGYHGLFKVPTDDELAVVSEYAKYFPVIAFPHMGAEYIPQSDNLRENVYRQLIENGSDMVIAAHPHWVQNTESYKGKLIAYSLGNFIFDQQFEQDVTQGALIDITFSLDYDDNSSKWSVLASDCQEFKDKCLEIANFEDLVKPEISFDFDALASTNYGEPTHKANSTLTQAVLKRLDWANTKSQLDN